MDSKHFTPENNSTVVDNQTAWRDVPRWEGLYQVSSGGEVRSIRRLVSINSVTPERKRWMGGSVRKPKPSNGYLIVTLTGAGRREVHRVHRLVLATFIGPAPEGQACRHLNGNSLDNRLVNLAWGTHHENMADRKAHGNYAVGDKHPMAKLTNEQALAIYRSNAKLQALSDAYGVDKTKISAIRLGHTWVDITGGKPRIVRSARKCDKLNKQKAEEMRAKKRDGAPVALIAAEYGMSESVTYKVLAGSIWK